MAGMSEPDPLVLRVGKLEWSMNDVVQRQGRNSERINQLERDVATAKQINLDLKQDVENLQHTLDKLVWAVVGLALTIAGSAVGIAILTAANG
jgi:hypothetical protein